MLGLLVLAIPVLLTAAIWLTRPPRLGLRGGYGVARSPSSLEQYNTVPSPRHALGVRPRRCTVAVAAQLELGRRDTATIADAVSAGLDKEEQGLWPPGSILTLAANAVAAQYAEAILSNPKDPAGSFVVRAQALADDESNTPRQYKRLLNQMVLAFLIADRRSMLPKGSAPTVSRLPEQIAKWSVLGTRWPELRDQIRRDPEPVRRGGGSAAGGRGARWSGWTRQLVRFLRAEPPLGPVVRQLITMSPAQRTLHSRRRSRSRVVR